MRGCLYMYAHKVVGGLKRRTYNQFFEWNRHHYLAKYPPSHNILQRKMPLTFSKRIWVKTRRICLRGCLYKYAHKGCGRFVKAGLKTTSSQDTNTKTWANAHLPTIYPSPNCHQIKVRGNGWKPQNNGCEDACICMPLGVEGGFKKKDLQPVPLLTQTLNLQQLLTVPPYFPARSAIKWK